jgi:hypothetical protein
MSINIKGAKYKVKIKPLDQNTAGLCYRDRKEIHINSEIPKNDFFKVLSHEIGHAYFTEFKIDHIISDEMEEFICLMLEDYAQTILEISGKKWGK